ncbi:hypothetical protein [Eggerthella guodeyinii]|uniref:hypothetical protein n=1 Tax=Eggerthella guodeyinii TaxID=2690837 RepID=UPI001C553C8C|nr:hypothetical protein [Eggerthella guodeyinii]
MPVDSDRMSAMPMMPIAPANAVSSVRPFLVTRLFSDRPSAVPNPSLVRRGFAGFPARDETMAGGFVSETTRPSLSRMMRDA